ncbi:MAG TPA: FG-GAP-like repeat-containing protein [Caulobacter sp.]|nr:FG-GAP-like repeat-containing protein [Caulobacter sp.]
MEDGVWNTVGGWSNSGAAIVQMNTLGVSGINQWANDLSDLNTNLVNNWVGGWWVMDTQTVRDTITDNAQRIQVANVESNVSHEASARDWRADIGSFTELADFVEGKFSEAYAAETTHAFSNQESRALYYMQWVSGLWSYGNLTDIYAPGAVQDNEVTGAIDPATMSVRTYLDSPIGCCTDYVTVLTFLLSQAGIETRVVGGSGHVLVEASLDGKWWALDANVGIAYKASVDQIIDTSTTVEAISFDHEGMQLGSTVYRESLVEFRQNILAYFEDGFFSDAYRYNTVDFFHSLPYGDAFLSGIDLADWPTSDTSQDGYLTVNADLDGLTVDQYYAMLNIPLARLHAAEVDSDVSADFADSAWRTGVATFADLAGRMEQQYAAATPNTAFSTAESHAFFYLQAVSGLWNLGDGAGATDVTSLLSAPTASQSDFATVLAALLTQAGIENRVVVTSNFMINEVNLDGHWWSLNAATGIAVEGAWNEVIDTSGAPRVYLFDNAHLEMGGHYQQTVDNLARVFVTSVANGVEYQFQRYAINDWALTHAFGDVLANLATTKTPFVNSGSWSEQSSAAPWSLGDFDGDGKADVFAYAPGVSGANMMLSSGSGFSTPSSWTVAGNGAQGWYVGDFNGDGKDDIFRVIPDASSAQVFLSNGATFVATGSWAPSNLNSGRWYIGDFNGDGRSDVLNYAPGVSGGQVYLSTGSSFESTGSWTGAGNGATGWLIGDFNGDDKDDLGRVINGTGVQILLSNGAGFTMAALWSSAGAGADTWAVGDFNGDGLDDLLRHDAVTGVNEMLLSDGTSFHSQILGNASDPGARGWYVGDFNGDGLDDVFVSATATTPITVELAQNTGAADQFVGQDAHVDKFVLPGGFGNDTIVNFDTDGADHDLIRFSKSVFKTYDEIMSHAQQVGLDVVITVDAHSSLTLHHTLISSLSADDFLFS